MGCTLDPAGITIQPVNNDGAPAEAPLYGPYVGLCGQRRPPDNTLPAEEQELPGSEEWFKLVAVADSQAKLDAIIHKYCPEGCDPTYTTAGSRRVRIETDIQGIRRSFVDRITIASGPDLPPPSPTQQPRISVVHVKVLPEGATMDRKHPLSYQFEKAMPKFQYLKE